MTENLNVRKAFAMALAEMPDMYTDAQANAGRMSYKYMQLPTMLEIVKPVLDRHGLALYQYVERDENGAGVVTCFALKETGETLCLGSYPMQTSVKPQDQGSALTYARRYSLMTALGVMPDKDDDGAAAQAAAINAGKPADVAHVDRETFQEIGKGAELVHGIGAGDLMAWLSEQTGRTITRGGQLTQAEAVAIMAGLNEAAVMSSLNEATIMAGLNEAETPPVWLNEAHQE